MAQAATATTQSWHHAWAFSRPPIQKGTHSTITRTSKPSPLFSPHLYPSTIYNWLNSSNIRLRPMVNWEFLSGNQNYSHELHNDDSLHIWQWLHEIITDLRNSWCLVALYCPHTMHYSHVCGNANAKKPTTLPIIYKDSTHNLYVVHNTW